MQFYSACLQQRLDKTWQRLGTNYKDSSGRWHHALWLVTAGVVFTVRSRRMLFVAASAKYTRCKTAMREEQPVMMAAAAAAPPTSTRLCYSPRARMAQR